MGFALLRASAYVPEDCVSVSCSQQASRHFGVRHHLHVRKSVPVSGRHHASFSGTLSNGSKSSRIRSGSRNWKPGSWSRGRRGRREAKGGGGGGAESDWVTLGLDNSCASASCRCNRSSSPHRGRSVTLLRLSAGYQLFQRIYTSEFSAQSRSGLPTSAQVNARPVKAEDLTLTSGAPSELGPARAFKREPFLSSTHHIGLPGAEPFSSTPWPTRMKSISATSPRTRRICRSPEAIGYEPGRESNVVVRNGSSRGPGRL